MQSKLFVALAFFPALSGCSEEIQSQDQPTTLPGEIRASEANELPSAENQAEAPDTEHGNPVGLD